MGEASSWLLLGKNEKQNIGHFQAVDFYDTVGAPDQRFDKQTILSGLCDARGKSRIVLPDPHQANGPERLEGRRLGNGRLSALLRNTFHGIRFRHRANAARKNQFRFCAL
jgi:hypothetical protein